MDSLSKLYIESAEEVNQVEEGLASTLGGVALGTVLALMPLTASSKSTRGMKNNNPGNIEYNAKVPWKGIQGTDGRFIKFDKMENGVRAIARILKVYQKRYGLNTIKDIINRFAPPSDKNPTQKYIDFVAKHSNIPANQKLDLNDTSQLYRIIDAIIRFENGKPAKEIDIVNGIRAERVYHR